MALEFGQIETGTRLPKFISKNFSTKPIIDKGGVPSNVIPQLKADIKNFPQGKTISLSSKPKPTMLHFAALAAVGAGIIIFMSVQSKRFEPLEKED